MIFTTIDIDDGAIQYLHKLCKQDTSCGALNETLFLASGIHNFFPTPESLADFKQYLSADILRCDEPNRREYGDFQTNQQLALKTVRLLHEEGVNPDVLIEPTFGKGRFIIAALNVFSTLKNVIGFEIHEPYIWETKFSILSYFLTHPDWPKPQITLVHQDIFTVDFQHISGQITSSNLLVLGNPPWVTNASLGAMNSNNLPAKTNFKRLNGLDAMTGKGNFDIGESITLMLLKAFQNTTGHLAFLVKNAVIKNIIYDQKRAQFKIGKVRQLPIDAQKEFGASVEASLLFCRFNVTPESSCIVSSFRSSADTTATFGWRDGAFVSNIEKYGAVQHLDGGSPLEWRQGLKHDCSAIMEFERLNGHFRATNGTEMTLEQEMVYGLLKSSDLKGGVIAKARKFTIVTQHKVGQDTSYIEKLFPETFAYLIEHHEKFAERKSSIYRGKPPFSIFGVGDYSFLPYKVAISGLYKTPVFTLVLPENGKPLMLDDTCYFLGFEKLEDAILVFGLLNSNLVANLLAAIAFPEAKRLFSKEVLMRINLNAVAASVAPEEVLHIISNTGLGLNLTASDLLNFSATKHATTQLQLF